MERDGFLQATPLPGNSCSKANFKMFYLLQHASWRKWSIQFVYNRAIIYCWKGPDKAKCSAENVLFLSSNAKSLQSCPTLCDPIDGSPPGSPVPGIPQARTLERGAISFSNAWKWKVKVKTPWTAAYQAPPSMDFPGKSTGVGCHCLLRLVVIEVTKVNL